MGEPVQSRDPQPLPQCCPNASSTKAENNHTIGSGATECGSCSVRPRERSTLKGGNHVKSDLRYLLLPVSSVALSGAEFCCLRRRQHRRRKRRRLGGVRTVPPSD